MCKGEGCLTGWNQIWVDPQHLQKWKKWKHETACKYHQSSKIFLATSHSNGLPACRSQCLLSLQVFGSPPASRSQTSWLLLSRESGKQWKTITVLRLLPHALLKFVCDRFVKWSKAQLRFEGNYKPGTYAKPDHPRHT